MTIEDRVAALFKEADPVPDPDSLASERFTGYLAVIEQRSSEMTQVDEKRAQPKPTGNRRPMILIALISAVIVGVLGIGLLVSNTLDEPDVADPPPPDTAQTVADRFFEARNAYDAETAMALMAPTASVNFFIAAELSEFPALLAYYEATGFTWVVDECVADESAPNQLTCPMTWTQRLSEALGTDPYVGEFRMTVENGLITVFEEDEMLDGGRHAEEVLWPFGDWVKENHFAERLVLFDFARNTYPKLTPQSIALWEQYTAEFAAEQATG